MTLKPLAVRKNTIRDNINRFVKRDVSEQGGNIKTSHDNLARVNVTVQQFLDERERILNHEGID